jgi:hypothetical protein
MSPVTHFHDEELIAYLNDGISRWGRARLRRHLASCLECRYRLNLLEEEILGLIESAKDWQETDLVEITLAKNVFLKRIEQEGPPEKRAGGTSVADLFQHQRWWLAAAASALLTVAFGMRSRTPGDLLAKARAADVQSSTKLVVRQEFELILSQPNTSAAKPRKMEVVFDPTSKRFSLEWRNADDSLVYGLWRPSAERSLEYYSADNAGLRPLHRSSEREEEARFGAALGEGLPDMEKTVVWWLENRDFEPIFLSREGLLVPSLTDLGHPHKLRDVQNVFMLQWTTSTMEHPSVFTLSMDASSYRPISQSLRCEAARVEVKLKLIRETLVPIENIDPAVFEPSLLLIMAAAGSRGFHAWEALFRLPRGEWHCG